MLGHWYTLLLRRIAAPPGTEYVEPVLLDSAIARSINAASALTTALTLQSATDIEAVTP